MGGRRQYRVGVNRYGDSGEYHIFAAVCRKKNHLSYLARRVTRAHSLVRAYHRRRACARKGIAHHGGAISVAATLPPSRTRINTPIVRAHQRSRNGSVNSA